MLPLQSISKGGEITNMKKASKKIFKKVFRFWKYLEWARANDKYEKVISELSTADIFTPWYIRFDGKTKEDFIADCYIWSDEWSVEEKDL